MATKLDDIQRPPYVDGAALKVLINRIGVLRESLREEMKNLTVEIDTSDFITKEMFEAHTKEFADYQSATNKKLQEITDILACMVSPDDVEEAYTAASTPDDNTDDQEVDTNGDPV